MYFEMMAKHMEDMSREYGMLAVSFQKAKKRQITPHDMAKEWKTRTTKAAKIWKQVLELTEI